MTGTTTSIGILQTRQSPTGATIQTAIRELGHRAIELDWSDISVETRNGSPTLNVDVDTILNWHSVGYHQYALERLGMIRTIEEVVPMVNPANAALLANHKPSGLQRLAGTDTVDVPDTYYSLACKNLDEEAKRRPDLVQKPSFGGGGGDVSRIGEDVRVMSGPQTGLIQSCIETPDDRHNDIRAFVVGGETITAMRRLASEDDWLTNISAGGDGEPVDLPSEAESLAERAVEEFGLDIAGVDLIQDTDGNWYILEVNAPAGFKGLHNATGTNVGAHIAAHLIEQAGGRVEPDAVESLADSLDMQDPETKKGRTVFYIGDDEEYEVAGRTGDTTAPFAVNEGFDGVAVDTELVADIGAGPTTGSTTSPIPGDDRIVPELAVWFKIDGEQFYIKAGACDLSGYDVDLISDVPYIISNRGEALPVETE